VIHSGVHQEDVDTVVSFIANGVEIPGGISDTSLVFLTGPALLLHCLVERVVGDHPQTQRFELPFTCRSLRKTIIQAFSSSPPQPKVLSGRQSEEKPVRYILVQAGTWGVLVESKILERVSQWIPHARDAYAGHTVVLVQVTKDGGIDETFTTKSMDPRLTSAFDKECISLHLSMRRPPQSMLWEFVKTCLRHHLNMGPGGEVFGNIFGLHPGESFQSIDEWVFTTCYRLKKMNAKLLETGATITQTYLCHSNSVNVKVLGGTASGNMELVPIQIDQSGTDSANDPDQACFLHISKRRCLGDYDQRYFKHPSGEKGEKGYWSNDGKRCSTDCGPPPPPEEEEEEEDLSCEEEAEAESGEDDRDAMRVLAGR
jgi:hypothetical protein